MSVTHHHPKLTRQSQQATIPGRTGQQKKKNSGSHSQRKTRVHRKPTTENPSWSPNRDNFRASRISSQSINTHGKVPFLHHFSGLPSQFGPQGSRFAFASVAKLTFVTNRQHWSSCQKQDFGWLTSRACRKWRDEVTPKVNKIKHNWTKDGGRSVTVCH